MARCSEKLQHTAHNRAKKSMSRFQKIWPWWTGKCASVSPMKNLTYFSSFCCLFLFSSFQDKNPLEEVTGLFTRQKGSFDCCFFIKFHLFITARTRTHWKIVLFVSILFWYLQLPPGKLSGWVAGSSGDFLDQGTFDCQVWSFFAVDFCTKRNSNSLKNTSFFLIPLCFGCKQQRQAIWLIAAS